MGCSVRLVPCVFSFHCNYFIFLKLVWVFSNPLSPQKTACIFDVPFRQATCYSHICCTAPSCAHSSVICTYWPCLARLRWVCSSFVHSQRNTYVLQKFTSLNAHHLTRVFNGSMNFAIERYRHVHEVPSNRQREVSGVHITRNTSAVPAGNVWQRPYAAWCSRFP